MSNLRPFNEIKLQWLQLLQRDHSLGDCAVRVASEIILTYSNGQTGKAWPSYSTLAEVLGKSVKTIQRAIHELELAGWFDVKRGNGSGQSTIYIPTEKSIIAACKAREKTDKIVTLHPNKGGQTCPKRRTKLSDKGRQNCPPNLSNKFNKKLNAREEAPPPQNRQATFPALRIPADNRAKLQIWQDWLRKNGLPNLDDLNLFQQQNGRAFYQLPMQYPPDVSQVKIIHALITYFQNRANYIKSTGFKLNRKAS